VLIPRQALLVAVAAFLAATAATAAAAAAAAAAGRVGFAVPWASAYAPLGTGKRRRPAGESPRHPGRASARRPAGPLFSSPPEACSGLGRDLASSNGAPARGRPSRAGRRPAQRTCLPAILYLLTDSLLLRRRQARCLVYGAVRWCWRWRRRPPRSCCSRQRPATTAALRRTARLGLSQPHAEVELAGRRAGAAGPGTSPPSVRVAASAAVTPGRGCQRARRLGPRSLNWGSD
jgi:hypothetical protein